MALSTSVSWQQFISCLLYLWWTKNAAASGALNILFPHWIANPVFTCLPPSLNSGLLSSVISLEKSSLTSKSDCMSCPSHLNPALFFLKALRNCPSMHSVCLLHYNTSSRGEGTWFYSLLHPQHLEQCLRHRGYFVEWIKEWEIFTFPWRTVGKGEYPSSGRCSTEAPAFSAAFLARADITGTDRASCPLDPGFYHKRLVVASIFQWGSLFSRLFWKDQDPPLFICQCCSTAISIC